MGPNEPLRQDRKAYGVNPTGVRGAASCSCAPCPGATQGLLAVKHAFGLCDPPHSPNTCS